MTDVYKRYYCGKCHKQYISYPNAEECCTLTEVEIIDPDGNWYKTTRNLTSFKKIMTDNNYDYFFKNSEDPRYVIIARVKK